MDEDRKRGEATPRAAADEAQLDMQLVADTFQTICDSSAYDAMIDSWDRKLASAGFRTGDLAGENELRRHYLTADSMLKRSKAPIAADPLETVVEEIVAPSILLDGALRVVTINAAGRRFFATAQGQIAGTGWLLAEEESQFLEMLRDIDRQNALHAVFRTRERSGQAGLVEAFPVDDPVSGGRFLAVRSLDFVWSEQVDAILSRAFGLTPTEIAICRLMVRGEPIASIARRRNVAVRTVRIQLSSIFAKAGAGGQVDLVRILSMLCARTTQQPGPLGIAWFDPLGTETVLRREDGRRLAFSWMGDPDGLPALLLPGLLNGYAFPPGFESILYDNGVKLYAMQRPGMGHSDYDPGLELIDDIADAVAFLCRQLGLDQVVAIGISTSAIPLARLAARPGNPLAAIIGQGRFLPYSAERAARRIPREQRTTQWLAINAPWAADIVFRNGLRALRQHGVDWMIERHYGDSAVDLETWRRPEIMPLLRNATAMCAVQGHHVVTQELRMRTADYTSALRALAIPFHWLHGEVDVFGTSDAGENFYTAAEIEDFLALNPLISLHRVAEAGDLMFYQRPEFAAQFIADTVRRHAGAPSG